MKRIKFSLSFLFILTCILIGFFVGIEEFLIYFAVVILHELAHFFVASRLGYKLKNIHILPYGVRLDFDGVVFYGNDEINIALAGPLLNIIISILCVAIWWCFPQTYYYLDYFCFCNLVLGLFNLLPCFPLDGGRILLCIVSKNHERQDVIKKTILLNYLISLLLVILFLLSIFSSINFTFLYIAIFLFAGAFNPEKNSKYTPNILMCDYKKVEKGAGVKIIAVSANMPLFKIVSKCSKTKFNIIYVVFSSGEVRVLSENNLANLCNKYAPALSINEIRNVVK